MSRYLVQYLLPTLAWIIFTLGQHASFEASDTALVLLSSAAGWSNGVEYQDRFSSLEKRAQAVTWDVALRRGQAAMEMMTTENEECLKPAKWLDFSQLGEYGWQRNDADFLASDLVYLEEPLSHQSHTRQGAQIIGWSQDKASEYIETTGSYISAFNIRDGWIAVLSQFNPLHEAESRQLLGEVTPLRNWSDLTWLTWANLAEEAGDVQLVRSIRSVFIFEVKNRYTARLMRTLLGTTNFPQWKDRYTASAESDEGKVLLGCPNGVGIGFFLSTHRAQLGHKVVKQISFWVGTDGETTNMLFEIEDFVAAREDQDSKEGPAKARS